MKNHRKAPPVPENGGTKEHTTYSKFHIRHFSTVHFTLNQAVYSLQSAVVSIFKLRFMGNSKMYKSVVIQSFNGFSESKECT